MIGAGETEVVLRTSKRLEQWLDMDADRLAVTEAWEKLTTLDLLGELAAAALLPDPSLLDRLWAGVSAPRTFTFLQFLYQRSRSYRREQAEAQVDDTRIYRSLLGMVSGAQVVRALLWKDPERLQHWVPASVGAWSGAKVPVPDPTHLVPPAAVSMSAPSMAALDAWYAPFTAGGAAHHSAFARAWARELFRTCEQLALRDRAPAVCPERVFRRTPVLIYQPGGTGVVCWLVVELDDAAGEDVYPDPAHLALQPMTREFLDTVQTAWQVAREISGRSGTVRWRIEGTALAEGGKLVLEGGSHGAALGVALTQLLRGELLDPRLGITATLAADGSLGPVAGVPRKAEAAFQLRDPRGKPLITRLLVHPENGQEARLAAAYATGAPQDAVVSASRLTDALREASGILLDLRRLVAAEASQILTEAARSLQRTFPTWASFRAFHVPVRVARFRRSRPGETAGQDGTADWLDAEGVVRVELPWQTARQETRRGIVLGAPGFGKTMLLWQEVGQRCETAWEQLRRQQDPETIQIAVSFRASELARALQQSSAATPDLPQTAAALLIARHELSESFHDYLRTRLEQGGCLLAVDALDDCPDDARNLLLGAFRTAGDRHPQLSFLLSSRREGYVRLGLLTREDELEILPFDDETQISQAIRNWFHDRAEMGAELIRIVQEKRHLRYVFRSPLLLRIACEIIAAAGAMGKQLPRWERRVELYRHFLQTLTLRWAQRPPLPSLAQRELFLAMAGETCLELLRQDLDQSSEAARVSSLTAAGQLIATVNAVQRDYPAMAGRQFLDDLCAAGILVNVGADRLNPSYTFAHRTFQEFLAANCLADTANRQGWEAIEQEVDVCAHLPAWQEVIVFLAGLLHQPAPLLRVLADPKRDDRLRHRLALAARCLPELDPASLHTGGAE
jgi:hypothetical protein